MPMKSTRGNPLVRAHRTEHEGRDSSVVERVIGNDEVGSSILPRGTIARFWSRVDVPSPRFDHNPCWLWDGAVDRYGYGQFKPKSGENPMRSHRVAWMFFNGPIPEGMMVLHSCDNPRCCNPDHLRIGTHQDNMADKRARDRAWKGGPRPKAAR